jgi:hypothetical protein
MANAWKESRRIFLFACAFAAIWSSIAASALPTSNRNLPMSYCAPGAVQVSIEISGTAGAVSAYTVDDVVPAGWAVSNISDSGQWNETTRRVRWFFLNDTPRTLTYTATSGAGVTGVQNWGSGSEFGYTPTGGTNPVIGSIGGESTLPQDCGQTPTPTPTPPAGSIQAARDLPAGYCGSPASPVTVTIQVMGTSGAVSAYTVDDVVPAGWAVSNISDSGQWNESTRRVRWFFLNDTPRTLTYTATPGAGVTGVQNWGSGSEFGYTPTGGTTPVIGAIGGDSILPQDCGQSPTPTSTPLAGDVQAARILPENYCNDPATPIQVTLQVSGTTGNVSAYTLDDVVPDGWAVAGISDSGQWNESTRRVRWFFLDDVPRSVTYTATPDASLTAPQVWGTGSEFGYTPVGGTNPQIQGIEGATTISNHCAYIPSMEDADVDQNGCIDANDLLWVQHFWLNCRE